MRRGKKPQRYHTVKTTRAEAAQWAREDLEKAISHLLKQQEAGPLSPAQAEQLARLQKEWGA